MIFGWYDAPILKKGKLSDGKAQLHHEHDDAPAHGDVPSFAAYSFRIVSFQCLMNRTGQLGSCPVFFCLSDA